MALTDRLKGLMQKAQDEVVEHKGQIQKAVGKTATAADARTGGKYHEQIEKAEGKADDMIDKLASADAPGDETSRKPNTPTAP